MTIKRAFAMALALFILAAVWLSVFFFKQKTSPKRKQERSVAVERPRRPVAKKVRVVGKIKPIENKIISGVFDRNIVGGKTKFERAIGRDVAVVVLYQSWGDNGTFPTALAAELGKKNKVLMVTWEPWRSSQTDWNQPDYRLSKIAAGNHDGYIKKWLSDARDLRQPIFVRFAHEMNGDWYPWGKHVNSPADYVAAWRHIVDLSRELRATNITWVWSPNEVIGQDNLDLYYPGGEYVDWIGVSGFNWGGLERWQNWRDYNQIFDRTFKQIRKYDKPIAIAEISSIENPRAGQQSRASWITEMLAKVKNSDPKVSMIIWFDGSFETHDKLYNWVIDGSPDSVQALKNGLADPVFTGHISN